MIVLCAAGSLLPRAPVQGQSGAPRTDFGVWPQPAPPTLPAANGYVFDPDTGVKILRVTDQNTTPTHDSFGTIYSNWHTFNRDNTRLLFTNEGQPWTADFNTTTFTVSNIRMLPLYSGNASVLKDGAAWSYTNPQLLYTVIFGTKLVSYNFGTGQYSPPIVDFTTFSVPGVDLVTNEISTMHMDAHDDVFVFRLKVRNVDQEVGYFAYKKSTNQILFYRDKNDVHHVLVDRSGRYALAKYQAQSNSLDCTAPSGINSTVIDLQANPITFTDLLDCAPDHSPGGHGDIGTGTTVGWGHNANTLTFRQLATPHQWIPTLAFGTSDVPRDPRLPPPADPTVIEYGPAMHLSMLADDESWSVVGTYDCSADKPFCGEVFQIENTTHPRVRRLFHHYSSFIERINDNTRDSPRPTISRDGRFIAFTSNWGNSGRRDLFIAAVPPVGPPPAAPGCLRISSADSSGSSVLSWVDNSNDETGFEIEEASLFGSTWSKIDTVLSNVTTYHLSPKNTGFYYRVRAVSGSLASAYSNTVCAKCFSSSACKAAKGTMWTAINNATLDGEGGIAKFFASPNSTASSVEKLLSGDGYIEFSPNTDGGGSDQIDVYLQDGAGSPNVFDLRTSQGYATIFENGNYRESAVFVVGDVLRIAVETINGTKVVRYYKNNVPIWTSTLTVTYPLDAHYETGWGAASGKGLASASLLGFSTVSPATWSDIVNATTGGGGAITKNAGGYWKASADTAQVLTGDGYVEYTINNNGAPDIYAMTIGLNSGDLTTLEYYWTISAGYADVHDTTYRASTTVAAGDKLKVAIEGGIVKFYKNGELVCASAVSPNYPLQGYWDSSVDGAGLTGAVIGTN